MPSNLNAADVLMYDWADRARRILDEYKRKNTPDLTPRGEITPLPPDPDEVAADFFFGKGTGSTAADILLGLTGPVAGPVTEAAGGQSGVLDWLPGGGVLKGAVFAVPKASRIIRGVLGKSLKGDYAVDEAYRIAQEAVDEVSRYGREISADDLKRAISERVEALGDVKGKVEISRNANDLADRTWSRAMERIEQGQPFTLKIPEEKVMFVSNASMDRDAEMASRTSTSLKKYRTNTKDKYDELLSRLSPEEQEALNTAAYEFGEAERVKALAEGKTKVQANSKAFKSRQAFTRNFLREKFPESPKPLGEIQPVEYELPENVASAATDARRKVYDESINSGLSEAQSRKAAEVAYHRVLNEMARTDPAFKEIMKGKMDARNNNIRVVMSKIDPEVMREIDEEASLARTAKKQSSLENGASLTKASSDGQSAYNSLRQRKVNEFIKSLGFKSFNDLRMNQYSQLRRNGNHVLADGTVAPVQATPSGILGGALDITDNDRMMQAAYEAGISEKPLMAADVAVTYESPAAQILSTKPAKPARLLPENEFSDLEVDEMLRDYGETPTADRIFNREYLEELMREAGY